MMRIIDEDHIHPDRKTTGPWSEPPPRGSYFPRFFDLPGELRNQILMYIVHHPSGIEIGAQGCAVRTLSSSEDVGFPSGSHSGSSDGNGTNGNSVVPLSLLLANSQLATEAEALFYHVNVFHADIRRYKCSDRPCEKSVQYNNTRRRHSRPGSSDSHLPRSAVKAGFCIPAPAAEERDDWSDDSDEGNHHHHRNHSSGTSSSHNRNLMGQPARFKIRHLVLTVQRLAGVLESKVVPALQELVLKGSLRRLEVRVLAPKTGGSRQLPFPRLVRGGPLRDMSAKQLRRNPAFLAVLRLLADPDLEVARARVREFQHYPVWCPFHHRAGAGSENGDCDPAAAVGNSLLRDGGSRSGTSSVTATCPSASFEPCLTEGDADGWVDLDVKGLTHVFGGRDGQWWSI